LNPSSHVVANNTSPVTLALSALLLLSTTLALSACDGGAVRAEREKLQQERTAFAAEQARAQIAADEKTYATNREMKARADELALERSALDRSAEAAKQQGVSLTQDKNATEKITTDAQQQTAALNAALEASKQYQNQQMDRAKRGRALGEAIVAAQSVKLGATEYFLSEGKWPVNNKSMGLPAAESFQTETLQSVTIEPFEKSARILVKFVNESRTGQQIMMVANVSGAGQVTWTCASPDVKDIQDIVPSCRYQAR
jgi:Pilin (bacterial filament)